MDGFFFFFEFDNQKGAEWELQVDSMSNANDTKFNMTMGSDLMDTPWLDMQCSTNGAKWDQSEILMKAKEACDNLESSNDFFK